MKINALMAKVESQLAAHKMARNDDKYLCAYIWVHFYSNILISDGGRNWSLRLEDILKLPSQESIARCRRKFQEKGKYLPTDWKVAQKRRIAEQTWKDYMITH